MRCVPDRLEGILWVLFVWKCNGSEKLSDATSRRGRPPRESAVNRCGSGRLGDRAEKYGIRVPRVRSLGGLTRVGMVRSTQHVDLKATSVMILYRTSPDVMVIFIDPLIEGILNPPMPLGRCSCYQSLVVRDGHCNSLPAFFSPIRPLAALDASAR